MVTKWLIVVWLCGLLGLNVESHIVATREEFTSTKNQNEFSSLNVESHIAATKESFTSAQNHNDFSDVLSNLGPAASQCIDVLNAVEPLLQRAASLHNSALCGRPYPLPAEAEVVTPEQSTSHNGRHGKCLREPAAECDKNPTPVTEDDAEPTKRACARSCLQLRDQADSVLPDGVYWLTGLPFPVYCDMSHDGGGWTLLLTSVSKQGWDVLSARERNQRSPSLTENYSILRHADGLRDLNKDDFFAYRIEAQAEKSRQRWGGIWLAPRAYSFIATSASQTNVHLVRQFDKWNYKDTGIERRMPWLNTRQDVSLPFVLSTTATNNVHWWGTLVTSDYPTSPYKHSPWIHAEAINSGTVLYWMREATE